MSDQQPDIDYQALAELRYQIRRFLRFSEQVARSAGIEPQHYLLLLMIKGLPAGKKPTIGELAERLQIQHNSAVELVNRLEERQLVERQRSESDQRQVIVTLTTRGEYILQKLASHHHAELQTIGPAFLRTLEATLVRSRENQRQLAHLQEGIDYTHGEES
ncbi:MAG TPA: MarR family transcriptional regulator [Ktedonobacterales bacterium]